MPYETHGEARQRLVAAHKALAKSTSPALAGWSDEQLRLELRARQAAKEMIGFPAPDLRIIDPLAVDGFPTDILLSELLARAKFEAQAQPSPAASQMVILLQGASDLLLIRKEADHAER